MSIIDFVDSAARDLRYALRGLARRPAFTFAAVVTLALGIGATTAIFSVVYSVLIKPLPYPDSDELVRIRHVTDRGDFSATSILYLTYRNENATFADIGAWRHDSATLTDRGEPDRVRALMVSNSDSAGMKQSSGASSRSIRSPHRSSASCRPISRSSMRRRRPT